MCVCVNFIKFSTKFFLFDSSYHPHLHHPPLLTPFLSSFLLISRFTVFVDVYQVAANQLNTVMVLTETDEYQKYAGGNLEEFYTSLGLEVIHRPIVDFSLPDQSDLIQDIKDITWRLCEGRNCLVHCAGGRYVRALYQLCIVDLIWILCFFLTFSVASHLFFLTFSVALHLFILTFSTMIDCQTHQISNIPPLHPFLPSYSIPTPSSDIPHEVGAQVW